MSSHAPAIHSRISPTTASTGPCRSESRHRTPEFAHQLLDDNAHVMDVQSSSAVRQASCRQAFLGAHHAIKPMMPLLQRPDPSVMA